MEKIKQTSIRRRSFGGQTGIGIWWRKRSSPSSILSEEGEENCTESQKRDAPSETSVSSIEVIDESTSRIAGEPPAKKKRCASATKKSLLFESDEDPILGWDDDLCRPIYHRSKNYCDAIATLDSFDDELVRAVSSGDSGIVECAETDVSTEVVDEDFSKESQDYTRDPLSVSPSGITRKESSTLKRIEGDGIDLDEKDASESFRIPLLKKTRTFGDRCRRRRPLSLILMQEEEEEIPLTLEQSSRRISVESSSDIAPAEGQGAYGEAYPKEPRKGKTPKNARCHDSTNSLEKAREYFANLDQTQPLTLDATLSPAVSSRVTRTSRRSNLTSPGIQGEYKAYVEAISGDSSSDILPLSIKDYASSRKLHFQREGKLVDGFLDD